MSFSNKAINAVALATSSAALITAIALGTSGVHRIRRDISQASYDNKILVLQVGSGSFPSGNSGMLLIGATSKFWFDINGNFAFSGSLVGNRGISSGATLKGGGGLSVIDTNVITKGTLSGAVIRSNVAAAGINHVKCYKPTGAESYCTSVVGAGGDCTCN